MSYSKNFDISNYAKHNIIAGYASVFGNIDRQGDVILPGAFAKNINLAKGEVKLLWQHDQSKPIGFVNTLKEDSYGLYVEAKLNSFSKMGREAIAAIIHGDIKGLSIGFKTIKAKKSAAGAREILSLLLWEISVVTFPANPKAQIEFIANKSCDPPNSYNFLLKSQQNLEHLTQQLIEKTL